MRMAASWIMGTSCARLGRIAKIKRGVKGIMTSWLMLKNSAIHRRAVDCCISSSRKNISMVRLVFAQQKGLTLIVQLLEKNLHNCCVIYPNALTRYPRYKFVNRLNPEQHAPTYFRCNGDVTLGASRRWGAGSQC